MKNQLRYSFASPLAFFLVRVLFPGVSAYLDHVVGQRDKAERLFVCKLRECSSCDVPTLLSISDETINRRLQAVCAA